MKTSLFICIVGLSVPGAWGVAVPSARGESHGGVSIGYRSPQGFAEISVGRERYYTRRGVFYRRGPRGYVVVRAPRGAVVRVLPPVYTRIYAGGAWYYRSGNVYYSAVPGGYAVVDAPVTVAQAAPPPPVAVSGDYQSVRVGDAEYLCKDGQFFRRSDDGLVWVEPPLGAITDALPADAQSIWYQRVEYFESDDVYFMKTPRGYQVVTAPWKK
jgi:hypothetical protein